MTRLAILLRSALLILTLVCVSQTMARSQKYKVSIKAKEQRLLDVFKTIQQQTKLIVFYSNTILNDQEKVSIQVKDEPLEKVLDQIVFGKALKYEVQEKYIVISPKEVKSLALTEGVNPQLENLSPPDITVKGRITNENGEPIPGASIQIKGTKRGTSADVDGRFTLTNVPDNATLVVSGTNIETVEMRVQGRTELSIVTKMRVNELEEVIVKPYWTEKKRNEIGNSGRITAKDIEKQPVQNPLLALQGRITGLEVTQQSGISGGSVTVRIQGSNSIRNSNVPLYVIDGVPLETNLPALGGGERIFGPDGDGYGSPLNYINPADIESIDVLKDADATAIYGTRAANGAILITTKKGMSGRMKVDLNFQQGWGRVTRFVDMMNRREYLDMRYEAFRNDGLIPSAIPGVSGINKYAPDLMVWDTTRETNWQKELLGGSAKYTNASVSISGGTANVQYRVSGTYNRQNTVFPGNFSDQRLSLHTSISSSSENKRLNMHFSTIYMFDNNKLPGADLTNMAVKLAPVAPTLYNPDGSLNWAVGPDGNAAWSQHPLAEIVHRKYTNTTTNLVSNLQLRYSLIKDLEFKTNFGFASLQTVDFTGIPLDYYEPAFRINQQRYAEYGDRSIRSWNIEPQLSYASDLRNAKLNVLVGATVLQNKVASNSIYGVGHASDQVLENFQASAQIFPLNSTITNYKYNGLFFRLNYNSYEKYILSLNVRRDGTSRFGAKNKFHNFGSIGAAWIFSKEKFLEYSGWISFGKIRGSYGSTGSDQVGDYGYLSLYRFNPVGVPYQNVVSLVPESPNNPYLQWEETRKLQGGIDLGFLKDRILFSATYTRNRSSNQLLSQNLPATTGANSLPVNLPALVQNITWEYSISSINVRNKKVEWNSRVNLSIGRNKLLAFPDIEKTGYSSLRVGEPLSINFVYKYAGVNPLTGVYQFYDKDGQITETPQSRIDQVVVSPFPTFYGGIQNTIDWNGLELDILCQFIKQSGFAVFIDNGAGVTPGVFTRSGSNQPTAVIDRWQSVGEHGGLQKYTTIGSGILATQLARAGASDLVFTDASFLRIKNLSLSWKIPNKWLNHSKLKDGRIYCNAQNLFTITRYKGSDPENRGTGSLPPLRIITLGLKVSL